VRRKEFLKGSTYSCRIAIGETRISSPGDSLLRGKLAGPLSLEVEEAPHQGIAIVVLHSSHTDGRKHAQLQQRKDDDKCGY
jgi:hypothetical protein